MYRTLFLLFFLFTACSPNDADDFRREGRAQMRHLVHKLREIHTAEELLNAEKELTQLFDGLVDLMIAAREAGHPSLQRELTESERALNDALRTELQKITRMEGGAETLKKCQQNALTRLHKAELKYQKKSGAA